MILAKGHHSKSNGYSIFKLFGNGIIFRLQRSKNNMPNNKTATTVQI